jgi:hypothetical protein
MSENLWQRAMKEIINGLKQLKLEISSSECKVLLQGLKRLKTFSFYKEIFKMTKKFVKCILRPTVILPLENRKIAVTPGTLIRQLIDLVMGNNDFLMELLCQFITKDLRTHSPRQLLLRRLLRMLKQSPKICLDNLRI